MPGLSEPARLPTSFPVRSYTLSSAEKLSSVYGISRTAVSAPVSLVINENDISPVSASFFMLYIGLPIRVEPSASAL